MQNGEIIIFGISHSRGPLGLMLLLTRTQVTGKACWSFCFYHRTYESNIYEQKFKPYSVPQTARFCMAIWNSHISLLL